MKTLKDANGNELSYDEVWEIAYDNALNSGEGTGPALQKYIDGLDDEDLVQWATDEEGCFPCCECGGLKKFFMKENSKNLIEIFGCPKCDS